jgi:hypothetical protein
MHEMWEVILFKHGSERNYVVKLGGGVLSPFTHN